MTTQQTIAALRRELAAARRVIKAAERLADAVEDMACHSMDVVDGKEVKWLDGVDEDAFRSRVWPAWQKYAEVKAEEDGR